MQKLFEHLKLVHQHRKYVRKICFKMGIFWRGIVHDLSKYSIQELKIAKYYNGKKSPHQQCRDEIGYSPVGFIISIKTNIIINIGKMTMKIIKLYLLKCHINIA